MDECIETYCLILYACASLSREEVMSQPKVEHNVHLIYDILHSVVSKIDPWFIEMIVTRYHEQGVLKEKLGATGETLYDLTEQAVIGRWGMFSDEFRSLYRSQVYQE